MEEDLLLSHMKQYFKRNYPPDTVSIEWPDGLNSVTRFEWFSGKSKDFGYTSQRWNLVLRKYQEYWRHQNNI